MNLFAGEDPTCGGRADEDGVRSAESGIGLEQALCWENAIRQALMPVTPKPSAEPQTTDKGDTKHHARNLMRA